ncbi:HD domain-containing protein [Candidatus Woesearchaeota archaeon]|nr:HD domain-containing protein [Candidatus Woesearchaeota archaeon]
MTKNNIDKIKELVLDLCDDKNFSWNSHVRAVPKYSIMLAKKLGANAEICELAAWLHDIKKLRGQKELHHVNGAEEACKILAGLGYPQQTIVAVQDCIRTHSSDENFPPESIEAKIVASADAMSHFDEFVGLTFYYCKKGYNISEAKEKLLAKYARTWKKMMPQAREMVQMRYDAIKLLLSTLS